MLLEVIVAVRQPRRPGQVVAHEAQHDAHDVGRRVVRPEELGQEFFQLAPPPLPPAQVGRDDGVLAVAAAGAVLAAQPGGRSFALPQHPQNSRALDPLLIGL